MLAITQQSGLILTLRERFNLWLPVIVRVCTVTIARDYTIPTRTKWRLGMTESITEFVPEAEREHVLAISEYAEAHYGSSDNFDYPSERAFAVLVDAARLVIAHYRTTDESLANATWSVLQGLGENLASDEIEIADARVWKKHSRAT